MPVRIMWACYPHQPTLPLKFKNIHPISPAAAQQQQQRYNTNTGEPHNAHVRANACVPPFQLATPRNFKSSTSRRGILYIYTLIFLFLFLTNRNANEPSCFFASCYLFIYFLLFSLFFPVFFFPRREKRKNHGGKVLR